MPATCLWFDGQAEEAARFYVDTFRACGRPAELGRVSHYTAAGPRPAGSVLMVEFTLDGHALQALNAGPAYTFSPAVSLSVECSGQAQLDAFWDRLLEGGTPSVCGWLTDRYGLSWQVFPAALLDMVFGPDPAATERMMRAMMEMVKLDYATLRRAYAGEA